MAYLPCQPGISTRPRASRWVDYEYAETIAIIARQTCMPYAYVEGLALDSPALLPRQRHVGRHVRIRRSFEAVFESNVHHSLQQYSYCTSEIFSRSSAKGVDVAILWILIWGNPRQVVQVGQTVIEPWNIHPSSTQEARGSCILLQKS